MCKEIFDYVKRWGIFAVLFVGLLVFMLSGYEKREIKLMDFIKIQSETNVKVSSTLERIDVRMCSIEEKLKEATKK
jgi:hypothetical protein